MDWRNVRRDPLALHGCFGWLHHAEGPAGDVAVLICPGLTRDTLDAHHSLRVFADAFAAAGYPAMRFDYPDIGDSCDIETAAGKPEHWSAWLQSLHDAADWLLRATACRRLVFCGLRIGGTLAALAAETRDDVAGLILLAPVIRPRSYLRQLWVEAGLQGGRARPLSDGLDFLELRLSAETVRVMAAVDLRQINLSGRTGVAVFAQSDTALLDGCAEAWTARGVSVHRGDFSGLEPLLRHNMQGVNQPADPAGMLRWLEHAVPPQPAAPAVPARVDEPALQPPGCVETPLRFGPDDRLFGILCRPRSGGGDLAVVFGNGGRDPHYGACRFGVAFARRLAAAGIASLRMDFSGLGDSIGPAGKEDLLSPLFEADRAPELRAAVDRLVEIGFRRFALQGLCSGAYHALAGAVVDARVESVLLLNLPVFTWNAGDTVQYAARRTHAPGYYLGQLFRSNLWRRGAWRKVDVLGIMRGQAAYLASRVREAALRVRERLGDKAAMNDARRAMTALSGRGVRTLFLFGPEEVGISAMEQSFGRLGQGLRNFDGATMRIVEELDHTLTTQRAREMAAEMMIDFLQKSGS